MPATQATFSLFRFPLFSLLEFLDFSVSEIPPRTSLPRLKFLKSIYKLPPLTNYEVLPMADNPDPPVYLLSPEDRRAWDADKALVVRLGVEIERLGLLLADTEGKERELRKTVEAMGRLDRWHRENVKKFMEPESKVNLLCTDLATPPVGTVTEVVLYPGGVVLYEVVYWLDGRQVKANVGPEDVEDASTLQTNRSNS